MSTAKFLPQWGRGTMRSMVEGHAPDRLSLKVSATPPVPLHHPAGGPPPRTGEER